jgi:hypothetical protein
MTPNDLHPTSAARTVAPRTGRRIVTDFLAGLVLFNLAACILMPRSIDAYAATPHDELGFATNHDSKVKLTQTAYGLPDGTGERVAIPSPHHFASLLSGGHDRAGRPLPGPIGLFLLSLVFASLTAFNLQLVRHLREAYVPAARKRRTE